MVNRLRPPHHLPLLVQDDGLPGPIPQSQGFIVGRRHEVVAVRADGQTPNLSMMSLQEQENTVKFPPATTSGLFLTCFLS